jgi:hypothetical protein
MATSQLIIKLASGQLSVSIVKVVSVVKSAMVSEEWSVVWQMVSILTTATLDTYTSIELITTLTTLTT